MLASPCGALPGGVLKKARIWGLFQHSHLNVAGDEVDQAGEHQLERIDPLQVVIGARPRIESSRIPWAAPTYPP